MTKKMESREQIEARINIKAWKDPQFKSKLLHNPQEALEEFGLKVPPHAKLHVHEEKENDWHLTLRRSPPNAKKYVRGRIIQDQCSWKLSMGSSPIAMRCMTTRYGSYAFPGKSSCALSSFLTRTEKTLPSLLIGEYSREKLRTFLQEGLFQLDVHHIGFECSLQDDADWGDFHFFLPVPSRELTEFYQFALFYDSSWQTLGLLLRDWDQSGYLLDHDVEAVVIELDIGSSSEWPPKPNVFLKFRPQARNSLEITGATYTHFYQRPLSDVSRSILQKYSEGDCVLSAVGFMLARPDCLRATVSTTLTDLQDLNVLFPDACQQGTFDSLFAITQGHEEFSMYPLRVGFDLSSGGKISDKIGVYVHTTACVSPYAEPACVLNQLEEFHLVNAEKKNRSPFL